MKNNSFEKSPEPQEWSHIIVSDEIDSKKLKVTISPSLNEAVALSKRLDIDSIKSLVVDLVIQRNKGNMIIHVEGHITADILLKCIATSDIIDEHIKSSFESWYADPKQALSFAKAKRERLSEKEKEEQPILEEFDDPEPIINGKIDVGEIAVQYLSLSLPLYPRSENSYCVPIEEENDAPEGTYNNPFAALKEWKIAEKNKKDK